MSVSGMCRIGALVVLLTLVVRAQASHYLGPPVITKTACQGTRLNIDCPAGQGLNIKSANYGRLPGKTACGSYGLSGCYTPNALLAVRAKCQGKSWCKVPANKGFFGGKCEGSGQYLQVSYTCDYPIMRTKFACQDSTLNIDCKKGHHIAIDHALFGRVHGNAVCPTDPYWLKSVHCVSGAGLKIVKRKCHSKRWCKVRASVDLFGDPCPGTHKYLFVRYSCTLSTDSNSNPGSNSSGRSSSGGSGSNSSSGGSSSGGSGSNSSSGGSSSGGSGSKSSSGGSSSGGSGSNSSGGRSSSGGSGSGSNSSGGRSSSSGSGSGSNSSGGGSGSGSGGSSSGHYH
ncbi:L-rhamnose-binding lectin CSL3-like [Patiria miniata]|uniref:SUEL-type lectin domain-containing protein n=1 Tax=Patiria miniata TaxID=46514 RepID=A0A914BTD0_PATMI|nr:L-rhamnose-binding lectin CSL3-like [Patiria miniata]